MLVNVEMILILNLELGLRIFIFFWFFFYWYILNLIECIFNICNIYIGSVLKFECYSNVLFILVLNNKIKNDIN